MQIVESQSFVITSYLVAFILLFLLVSVYGYNYQKSKKALAKILAKKNITSNDTKA